MSKVFNMVGGGGKNISSIIITGLESTDTVTCTKDGKSYTATWDSTAQHWEIVGLPLGTFTVTATNGTKTITETVLIDINGVYEIEMYFKLWLYRDGDECESVTGGWEATGTGTVTKNDTYMSIVSKSDDTTTTVKTVNELSLEGYTKLFIDAYGTRTSYPSVYNIEVKLGDTIILQSFTYNQGRHTESVDLSLGGTQKLSLGSGNGRTSNIYNVWLE